MTTKKEKSKQITFSHLEKIYYPQSNITKEDVITYYLKIAPHFLALAGEHLFVMQRFPDGIHHEGFYQKQIPDYFPRWIKRKKIMLYKGDSQSLVVIDSKETLAYLANQGVLVFHSWLSSIASVKKPDKIVFDLDPSGADLKTVKQAARLIKTALEEHNLVPFIMTTGSQGYHVVTPIVPHHSFTKVHAFAKRIAHEVAVEYDRLFTVEVSKSKRKRRVFIDYLRNSYGQTSVACYSLRAIEGAPIATPLAWSELARSRPQQYTIKNIFKRLRTKKDPWYNFRKSAKMLDL